MFSFRPQYKTLNWIEVSKEALEHNHQALQAAHPESKIAPVLKSNAYGHGLQETARVFDSFNAPFVCVDSLYEAYDLTKARFRTPILIMGYTHQINFSHKKIPFEVAIFDLQTAQTLNRYQPGCRVHLFIDTGMGREGVSLQDLPTFLKQLSTLSNLKVVGLGSHFAEADDPKETKHWKEQVKNFKKAHKLVVEAGFDPQWKHISASAGAFKFSDPFFNLIRVGKASYGLSPLQDTDQYFGSIALKPALKMFSTLASIKSVSKGKRIGYGGTFTTKKAMTLGLLPIGYNEGIDRRLSNIGCVKIRGRVCPIIGRISMNMTVIDLSDLPNPQQNEMVEIFSNVESDPNSLRTAAKLCNTIPYEMLVRIHSSVKRILV